MKFSSLAEIPADVLNYKLKRLPAWVRMGRTGAVTIMEVADLRRQRDAVIKLVEELQRELKKARARMRGRPRTPGKFADLA